MRATVIGGGVIGLSVAWELARKQWHVTLLDAAPEAREASWAAAGMLAPHHESDADTPLWRLGVESLMRWPAFIRDLCGDPGALDYGDAGGLMPSVEDGDEARIAAKLAFCTKHGVAARWHDAASLRRIEPKIANARGALEIAGAHVDPRSLARHLAARCVELGATLRYGTAARAIDGGTVELESGEHIVGDQVVLACGAWTPELARLSGIDLHGEPVKGQLLRINAPGLLRRFVHGHALYAVPRRDGLVIGATMVRSGFDKSEDPVAIAELWRHAIELIPELADATITETWTGLRPRLRGGLPLISRIHERLIIATGHFRNGILLTPITAAAVASLARKRSPPCDLTAFQWSFRPKAAVAY